MLDIYQFMPYSKKHTDNTMFYGAEPFLFKLAKEQRNNPTRAEQFLWEYLKNNKLGVKFRRQHPVFKYIADFYCHELRLIIEVDGDYHRDSVQTEYDEFRSEDINDFGIKVIRFNNEQVLNDIQLVINQIKQEIILLK